MVLRDGIVHAHIVGAIDHRGVPLPGCILAGINQVALVLVIIQF